MSPALEKQLIEMGVIPATPLTALAVMLAPKGLCEEMEKAVDSRPDYMAKGYYNDPRDENGEVNF